VFFGINFPSNEKAQAELPWQVGNYSSSESALRSVSDICGLAATGELVRRLHRQT
jgi:hypothetical protein